MTYRTRTNYTAADKALMWDRWRRGDSLEAIAQLFDQIHGSVAGILGRSGGIQPLGRKRSRWALTRPEREEISLGVVAGQSIRAIASSLGRSPSTVSRELSRNGGRDRYRANPADQAAWDRAHRPKSCKLVENRTLARIVATKLRLPGRLSKLRAGRNVDIRATRATTCHMKPSIAASSSKPVGP